MDLTNRKAEEIYQQFNYEKIICGIKNITLETKFIKSYISIFLPLLIALCILNIQRYKTLVVTEKTISNIIIITSFILFIFNFLKQSYKLYFDNNYIIFENKLNKIIAIDVNRYPRIYIRHKTSSYLYERKNEWRTNHSYILHIEQDDIDFEIDIRAIGSKNVKLLLNNLETKERQDVTESQWQSSSNKKEKTFSNYMSFLNKQKKIIGVKNYSNNMKINNNKNLILLKNTTIF